MKHKQKATPSNILVRSDEKLGMLGLFAVAWTISSFFILPELLNPPQRVSPTETNNVYKVEEVPAQSIVPPEMYTEEYLDEMDPLPY